MCVISVHTMGVYIMRNYLKRRCCYKEYARAGIGNNRVYGVLLCLKHLLKNDAHWNLFVDKIDMLFDKYESVQISTMGFPENWKELLQHK